MARTTGLLAAAGAACAVCVTALSACGPGSSSPAAQSAAPVNVPKDIKATLRIAAWSSWGQLPIATREFQKQYPNVKFVFESVQQPYFNGLPETLASSDVPDITAIQAYQANWTQIVKQGLVANLSDVWARDGLKTAYAAGSTTQFKGPGGAPYATPVDVAYAPVIYYNKAAFAKAGLAPPAGQSPTLQEWDTIVARLKAAGYVPLAAYGNQDGNGLSFPLGTFLQTSCGLAAYGNLVSNWEKPVTPATTWTSPCAMRALAAVQDWAKSGVFGSSPATNTLNGSISLFAAQKAAMFEGGSWDAFAAEWQTKLDTGWFLPPPVANAADAKTLFAASEGDGLAVASHSPNIAVAKAFLAFAGSRSFQASPAYLKAPGASPRTDLGAIHGYPALAVSQLQAVKSVGTAPNLLDVPYGPKIEPLLDAMIAGTMSQAAVAGALNSASNELRSG